MKMYLLLEQWQTDYDQPVQVKGWTDDLKVAHAWAAASSMHMLRWFDTPKKLDIDFKPVF